MPQPIPYVIDFDNMTISISTGNDKILPPEMEDVRNINLARKGRAQKIYGVDDLSTSADLPGTRTNAVCPVIKGDLNDANSYMAVQHDTAFYTLGARSASWAAVSPSTTIANAYPWNISWGINTSACAVIYFSTAAATEPVFGIDPVNNSIEVYGYTHDALNVWTDARCAEFFLDKLWVGATSEGATPFLDRIRWSVTGDDDDFHGSGSGFFDLRAAGGGSGSATPGIRGMRVYQNKLWFASGTSLWVLTGTTSSTFGKKYVIPVNYPNGATLYEVGGFLFWVDFDGIWQFNGRLARNIMTGRMWGQWTDLSLANDVDKATATWDDVENIYKVYFPTVQEEWSYFIDTGQWSIRKYNTADAIRVIGPPSNKLAGRATNYPVATITNGKVFNVNDQVITDDGATITGSVITGNIRLAEMNGGRPGDHARLLYMDIETVKQDEAGVVKVEITIDGTAQTTASLTVGDAGSSADNFPTHYDGKPTSRIDLGAIKKAGRFFKFRFLDDDANSRMDLRRVTIWYERLENAGFRPA